VSEAPFGRRLLTITARERFGPYVVLRAADPGGPAPAPGQFAMLAAAERWGGGQDARPYVPRAFSVARFRDGEAHFVLEDVGPGTRRLCELAEGEQMWALGPLGRGFRAPAEGRRAILVAGGIGIAPIVILRDSLTDAGASVLLGFRDGERARAAELVQEARVATDDGSVGHHGPCTELLAAELERDAHAVVYACGPPPMLEAVRALCAAAGVPAQLALEAGMACGFGACFGCVVPRRGGGYLRVCVDGPVVDAGELERVPEPEAHGVAS
jgi:dihydroorotate dehydrogenase electron transfer subunit